MRTGMFTWRATVYFQFPQNVRLITPGCIIQATKEAGNIEYFSGQAGLIALYTKKLQFVNSSYHFVQKTVQ
jgi:hypothetical protein